MEGSDAFPGSTGYSGILSKCVLQNILTFGALGAKGPVMDKEQRVLSHTAQWEDRALAATSPWLEIQGAGKAGTPHNSLFASGIYFCLSYRHLCLVPEGKGDGDAVFSVLGKKWRRIRCRIWTESLLIPALFSKVLIQSKALAPQSEFLPSVDCQIPAAQISAGSCTQINPLN